MNILHYLGRALMAVTAAMAGVIVAHLLWQHPPRSALAAAPFEAGARYQNPLAPVAVGLLFGCASPWSNGISSAESGTQCWDIARNEVVSVRELSASLPPQANAVR